MDWYKHASKVINILMDADVHNISLDFIVKYLIYHYLDSLNFDEKMCIIKKIFASTFTPSTEQEDIIRQYFTEKTVQYKSLKGITIADNNELKIYVQSAENAEVWMEAKPTEKNKLSQNIIDKFIVSERKYSEIIGFMDVFKNKEIVFKLKDTKQTHKGARKGARLNNEGKADIIKRLNEILEEKMYYEENTENIFKMGLCVIVEVLLRYFNDINHKQENKKWFFDVESALLNKIVSGKN
jgi:hypothetical protein